LEFLYASGRGRAPVAGWQIEPDASTASTPQLYHYLNHMVLFGSGYAGSVRGKLDLLLKLI